MNKISPKGFFVTGTDTDIGKTYVCKLLVTCFSRKKRVTYMKPVQTGCILNDEQIVQAPDLEYVLSDQSMMTASLEEHVPYRFLPACSPHLAASISSQIISLEYIRKCLERVSANIDLTIVEGAGGILAPLSETIFMVDLMQYLQLPVILVSSPHLGTLNHTFLSLKILRQSGVALAGIVMNNCRNIPEDFMYNDNIRMILEHTRPVPFLEISYGDNNEQRLCEFCTQVQKYL